MNHGTCILTVLFTLLLAPLPNLDTSQVHAQSLFPDYPRPAHLGKPILTNVPLQINVLFLGVAQSLVDRQRIQSQLDPWYTQINRERYDFTGQMEMYINFTIQYNFVFLPSTLSNAYSQFISTQHVEDTAPQWLRQYAQTAWYVNASSAEDWLKNNLPIPSEGYSLVIIDTSHLNKPITDYYFYDGTRPDPDTGRTSKNFTSRYMIGHGGDYRFLFLDLSAGPTCNRYDRFPCPNNADVRQIDTYDFTSGSDLTSFNNDLARYIRYAVDLRFTPSPLYHPVYRDSFFLNATIFSADPTIQFSNYLNMSLVINVFRDLLPLSNFTGSVREVSIGRNPSLYTTVSSATNDDGSLDGHKLASYFLQDYRHYVASSGRARVTPIFIFGGYHFSGFSGEAYPTGNGNFAFVLIGTDQHIIDTQGGLTHIIIHEGSHAFGLPHPHDGFDWKYYTNGTGRPSGEFVFWAYDYSSSLTTYATLNTFPDQMNYDQRDMDTTAVVLNETYTYLQAADYSLSRLGYTETPASVTDYAKIALNYSATAISLISQPNPNYENASRNARDALIAARSAYATAIKLPQATTSVTTLAGESSAITSSVTQAQTQSLGLTTPNSTGSVDYTSLIGVIVLIASVTIAAYGLWQRSKAKTARS